MSLWGILDQPFCVKFLLSCVKLQLNNHGAALFSHPCSNTYHLRVICPGPRLSVFLSSCSVGFQMELENWNALPNSGASKLMNAYYVHLPSPAYANPARVHAIDSYRRSAGNSRFHAHKDVLGSSSLGK